MRICATLRTLFICFTLPLGAATSFGHEDHDHAAQTGDDHDTQHKDLPTGLLLPAIEGPRPWSDKPVLNSPDRFQIAIMTDRTGGHRPGIWMDAVRKINMLRPEFVMSVGDLIEGYTTNEKQIETQWREFLSFIDQMEMRFFFVAGNHDLSNPVLQEKWREKFGRPWYSFDYKGVHFLCLCSEDPVNRIGEEQLAFARRDLEEHADARWTLVFLHKPLWVYAERELVAGNEESTNWKRVEAVLADRPHTVFAGHVHHYVQYDRNDSKYFSLATTGGGSQLRGNAYGEFDHVMWLTMEKDGPHLANIRLDGVLPPDVVTESSAKRFNSFLANTAVEVAPILIASESGFSEGELSIRLHNNFNAEVRLNGEIEGLPLRGLTVEPAELTMKAAPGEVTEKTMRIVFSEPIEFESLARTTLKSTFRSGGESELLAESLAPVVIDRRYACPPTSDSEIDGEFSLEGAAVYSTLSKPMLLGAVELWQGPTDSSLRLSTSHDDERLYLTADVQDERVLPGEDRVEFLIDGRPVEQRQADPRQRNGTAAIEIGPAQEDGEAVVNARHREDREPLEGVEAAVRKTENGYRLELSLPLGAIKRLQGDDWHSFQMAAIVRDVDEPNGEATEVLWRGSPDARQRNSNYGYFVRTNE